MEHRTIKIKCVWCNAGNHDKCTGTHHASDHLSYKCVCETCERRQPTFVEFEHRRIRAGV